MQKGFISPGQGTQETPQGEGDMEDGEGFLMGTET